MNVIRKLDMKNNVVIFSALPSGILSSNEGSTFIVFGGKVATALESNGKDVIVSFDELKEAHSVGDDLTEFGCLECKNEGDFPINMIFHNQKEIDVMISVLEEAKKQLNKE